MLKILCECQRTPKKQQAFEVREWGKEKRAGVAPKKQKAFEVRKWGKKNYKNEKNAFQHVGIGL